MSELSLHSDLSDSTASLFSILDHDSFEDDNLAASEGEGDAFVVISPVRLENTFNLLDDVKGDTSELQRTENKNKAFNESMLTETVLENGSKDQTLDDQSPSGQTLTPWQKWFINKMENERAKKRRERLNSKKNEATKEQEAKDKEEYRQNLRQKAAKLRKLRKRRLEKQAAINAANIDKKRRVAEETKQKSMEAFRDWTTEKQEEVLKRRRAEKQKETVIKQITAQKTLIAQQAFNDWLLTKQLSQDISFRRSRFFSTPRPPLSLPAWRGRNDPDSLPFDFSTRLFLS